MGKVMLCKSMHMLYMAWERTHLGYLCSIDVIFICRWFELQVRSRTSALSTQEQNTSPSLLVLGT